MKSIDPESQPLQWRIGQMLAVGFAAGQAGMAALESVVNTTKAGNIILFSRNTPDAATTLGSVRSAQHIIKSATGMLPLVAIDQEGGIVMRIRKGVVPIPGAMAQAASCLGGSTSVADIEALGSICGSDLRELGINWNLAPVVDVNVNPNNPVIGVRSYGENPALVADYASAFASGIKKAGIMATAKHFPGHGDTRVDSHLDLPIISHDLETLKAVDLVPFQRLIAEGVASVLVAHVQFPALEKEPIPATFSKNIVEGLLRGTLGFDGIICTDCMEMKAVADRFSDPYVKAVLAGADIIVVSHTPARQIEAAESIYRAVMDGLIPEERINNSVSRILRFKDEYCNEPSTPPESARLRNLEDEYNLVTTISRGSLTLLSPLSEQGQGKQDDVHRVQELEPDHEGLTSTGFLVDVLPENLTGVEDEAALPSIATELAQLDVPGWEAMKVSANPTQEELATVSDHMQNFCAVGSPHHGRDDKSKELTLALSLFAPFSHKSQLDLLGLFAAYAAKRDTRLIIFLMRSPYDCQGILDLCKEHGCSTPQILAAYEYTSLSAHSVAEFLAGTCKATGVCPVTIQPHVEKRL